MIGSSIITFSPPQGYV